MADIVRMRRASWGSSCDRLPMRSFVPLQAALTNASCRRIGMTGWKWRKYSVIQVDKTEASGKLLTSIPLP
jgi:hypothetical protein